MTTATGGELLARALREAGVTEVFTLHGGHLDAFLSACEPREVMAASENDIAMWLAARLADDPPATICAEA
ncbi:MAG: thiamine pyrophosphate-binding protein [Microthrixaceae bacterium]